MASEILIRFKTQALERGKQLAKEIAASVKESAKGIKDKVERKAFLAAAGAAIKERKEALGAASTQLGLEKRAKTLRNESQSQADQAVARALIGAKKAQDVSGKVAGVVGAVAGFSGTDPLGAGLAAASLVGGPVGQALAAAVGIVKGLKDYVDREFEKQIAKRWAEIEARIDRALADADQAARYQRDPRFREKLNAEATAIYVARRDSGWEPRGSAYLNGDE